MDSSIFNDKAYVLKDQEAVEKYKEFLKQNAGCSDEELKKSGVFKSNEYADVKFCLFYINGNAELYISTKGEQTPDDIMEETGLDKLVIFNSEEKKEKD